MTKNLDDVSIEVLQQRFVEELDIQQRLQEELQSALESERNLRLENDLLWVYLERKHPSRVKDAQELLARLAEGNDISIELQQRNQPIVAKNRTVKQRVRGAIGRLPGVHRVYHRLKTTGK